MLEEFLTANRAELIARCESKSAKRSGAPSPLVEVNNGVPRLLEQIVAVLSMGRSRHWGVSYEPSATPSASAVGVSAAIHGSELLRRGYSVDQVVHEYGDVCQAVTELAKERHFSIHIEEFRVLNQCLDNAIADAVTSYGAAAHTSIKNQADGLQARIANFSIEQGRLVDIASSAFVAIRSGNVGPSGATGALLMHTLAELLHHADHVLPSIILDSSNPTVN